MLLLLLIILTGRLLTCQVEGHQPTAHRRRRHQRGRSRVPPDRLRVVDPSAAQCQVGRVTLQASAAAVVRPGRCDQGRRQAEVCTHSSRRPPRSRRVIANQCSAGAGLHPGPSSRQALQVPRVASCCDKSGRGKTPAVPYLEGPSQGKRCRPPSSGQHDLSPVMSRQSGSWRVTTPRRPSGRVVVCRRRVRRF